MASEILTLKQTPCLPSWMNIKHNYYSPQAPSQDRKGTNPPPLT
jgi:hypothetical protein